MEYGICKSPKVGQGPSTRILVSRVSVTPRSRNYVPSAFDNPGGVLKAPGGSGYLLQSLHGESGDSPELEAPGSLILFHEN